MSAKEYLQELRKLDICIEQKMKEYHALCKNRGSIAGLDYARDKVQTSQGGGGFTKMSDKMLDLQQEINNDIDRLCVMRSERIRQIQAMDRCEYIDILHRRYVEYQDLGTISDEMGYSHDHIKRMHGRALNVFFNMFLKDATK